MGGWSSAHWGKTLLIALFITVVMGFGFHFLKLELTYYSMMPRASQKVRDLKEIIENFPAASSIVVVLEAKNRQNGKEASHTVKAAVDKLTEELSGPEYSEYIEQVDGKMNLDFFKKHGLMLSKVKDIEKYGKTFSKLGIVPFITSLNNDFEKEYSGNEENFSKDEQQVTAQFQGLKEILQSMQAAAAYKGKDSSKLLPIRPAFTINDMDKFAKGVPLLDKEIKQKADSLGVKAGLTGLLVVAKDEMETSEKGLTASNTIALVLILLIMILSFRMYSAPFISGIPLIIGIRWTLGLTGFVIKRLNILTAMYMIALIGLGIDYAIHLLTTFIQERDEGNSFTKSVALSLKKSGAGIVMGALTTAVAFFALTVAKSGIVKELGIVAGLGILCELLAMLILIPSLLGYRNYRLTKRGKNESIFLNLNKLEYRVVSRLGNGIKAKPLFFMLKSNRYDTCRRPDDRDFRTRRHKSSTHGNSCDLSASAL